MRWNAFELVSPAINKTKSLLFPIKVKYWLKLGLVSALSVYGSFGGGGGGNGGGSSFSNQRSRNITGNAIGSLTDNLPIGKIIALSLGLLSILVLIYTYITSMFTFVFVDALVKKKYQIRDGWRNYRSQGMSFLLFRISMFLITLIGVAIIALPVLTQILNIGLLEYIKSFTLSNFLTGILPLILLIILWLFVIGIFKRFSIDLGIPHNYKENIGMWSAVKATFGKVRQQKVEALVYYLARIVLSIGVAIISIIVLIPLIIVALIIGAIFFFSLAMISKAIAIASTIVLVILFFYLFNVVCLPLSTFIGYFSLLAYEKFFNRSLFSKA